MGAAETPVQAQGKTFLQEWLSMFTQVGQAAGTVSPTGKPGHNLNLAVPTCAKGREAGEPRTCPWGIPKWGERL